MLLLLAHFNVVELWKAPEDLSKHKPVFPMWESPTLPPLDVRKYTLSFTVLNGYLYKAEVTLDISPRWSVDSAAFDFYGYGVDSITLNGNPVPFSTGGGVVLVRFPTSLSVGDVYSLKFFYSGDPSSARAECPSFTKGIYVRSDGSFFTLSYPDGFRCWVPSLDRPYEKADEGVEFFIETDTAFVVVANGVLLDTLRTGTTKVWHFRHSHPIATYLISMAGKDLAANSWTWNYGPFNMPVLAWVDPSDTSLHWGESLTQMLTAFSDRFGIYPFYDEKYEQSVVMGVFSGGMEHQTSVHFSSTFGEDVQAHELCHQWWGNAVGYGSFKDVWLGEGFATYCEALWQESTGGLSSYLNYYKTRIENVFFTYASNPGKSVYDPGPSVGDILSVYTYHKGAAVLHMLRYVLDKDTSLFFGALRYYRSRHEGSYALTSDFVNDVETYTGRDLGWFFEQWVYEAGWPVYNVRWNRFDEGGSWRLLLRVEQVQPVGAPTFKMPIEVEVFTPSGDTTVVIWDSLDVQHFWITLSDRPDSVRWDPDNWVLEEHTVSFDPALGISEHMNQEAGRDIVIRFVGGGVVITAPLGGEVIEIYDRGGRRVARGFGRLKVNLRGGVYYAVSGAKVKAFVVR